eukprot:gene11974-13569_t
MRTRPLRHPAPRAHHPLGWMGTELGTLQRRQLFQKLGSL